MENLNYIDWIAKASTDKDPVLDDLQQCRERLWINPKVSSFESVKAQLPLNYADIEDASARLERFAAYFKAVFPETAERNGIIESPLTRVDKGAKAVADLLGTETPANLLVKCDSHLPISGSIKARGGIYEVLQYAEKLAEENGLLHEGIDYACFDSEPFKALFAKHGIVVGSTGNLGLSIGIMSAKLGFNVTVHMSADAREWKKAMLRSKGVNVVEHKSDYSVAVAQGREEALATPGCHFVDDEDSTTLFLGYSVAALRLKKQLAEQNISVDAQHPLIVYLPCGVGGGPGGVAFGLKHVFGDAVHCFFAEPTHSPCMLLGMHSGLHNGISVQDIGLDNLTCADGLAVGRPSAFVGDVMDPLLDGIYTASDDTMHALVKLMTDAEQLSIEPSAAAGLPGFAWLQKAGSDTLSQIGLSGSLDNATHLAWATGGNMVPAEERAKYYALGEKALKEAFGR
ncbi:D-serine ammonia-lyase [Marinobacterium mangrovicola]|uniref:Probable D-serine dehydratase n=1 Tax=Marinobacterium mangrovicola TaxID=1476959 RepID=A0A4V6NCX3_9GAMM|nr:D-serine ammonia-lyase [Marinobacterium mangrovicola]TCK04086.1 D-serine ammonia-lyase [Marinobacterium mangrovicola]